MLHSLIAALDALLPFARKHAGTPLDPSTLLTEHQFNELRRLAATLYAQCHVNQVPLPGFPHPAEDFFQPFGNSKIPFITGTIHLPGEEPRSGLHIFPTPEWVHALDSLRATAEAMMAKEEAAGDADPRSARGEGRRSNWLTLPADMWPRCPPK
jgi:hypothetical protein